MVRKAKLAGIKSSAIELQAVCYKVVDTNRTAVKYFYLNLNLGIANGTKVGLKLRLDAMFSAPGVL